MAPAALIPVLAHLGGLPIEESLIYLVPPLAIVGWIYLLGRRERRNPRPADDPMEVDLDEDVGPASGAEAGRQTADPG